LLSEIVKRADYFLGCFVYAYGIYKKLRGSDGSGGRFQLKISIIKILFSNCKLSKMGNILHTLLVVS